MTTNHRLHTATFVVSAGRCGTQWLADTLSRNYGDLAEIRHEPIDYRYCPRILLRSSAGLDAHPHRADVLGHVEYILDVLRHRDYLETGWPVFAAIPMLREFLGSRMRVIHLTRHPVPNACSLVTHRYYQPDLRDDGYALFAVLDPANAEVLRKDYAARWDRLSVYEKCLFHWAEIHTYALELRNSFPDPDAWFSIRMEDMFTADTRRFVELLNFLRLPIRNHVVAETLTRIDDHQMKTYVSINWREIGNHPAFVALAASLGYDPLAPSFDELMHRYQAS
jgi:hypothetical protein